MVRRRDNILDDLLWVYCDQNVDAIESAFIKGVLDKIYDPIRREKTTVHVITRLSKNGNLSFVVHYRCSLLPDSPSES